MAKDTAKTKDKDSAAGAKKAASKKSEGSFADAVVQFAGDIEIFPSSPVPGYNSGRNKAYKAISRRKSGDDLIAIVCDRSLIPRRNAASVYSAIINPGLVPVVAYGKVYWPPAKQELYVIVYKHVLGSRLLEEDQPLAMGWKQDLVMDLVVQPMVNILQDFRDKDFVHGALRPTNMFEGGGSGAGVQRIILGDCLSMQASYGQSVLYEPIERAQAHPAGRGIGTLADDMYAFGVCIAVMMRSNDPLSGKSDDEIIREKINSGSYSAVTGKDRFKGSILELLRGLLHDDPSQRWTVDEVMVWLDGRRLSPKQSLKRKKAARPFSFGGVKYVQTPLFAMNLEVYPTETVKVVEDGSLSQWLERSLEDDHAVEKLQEAYQSSVQSGRGAGYQDRMVANVSTVLDAMGPIRFRGLRMSGDGVGAMLYEAMALKQDVKPFADMFLQSIAMNWVTSIENPNLDVGGLISKFDSCRNYLRQNKLGFGIERCLYALNKEAPCLSPKLQKYYVSTPEDLMYAFEDLCSKGESPGLFLDRHSIAFLSVKDTKLIDAYLFDLNAAEDHKNLLANLKCLATIQKRSKMSPFPHIAKALNRRLPVIYKRYHDKNVRERLKENIEKYVKAGDIVKIAGLLDSPEVQAKDFRGFREAMIEYADLREEHQKLEYQLKDESVFGRATGKEIAALMSGALATLIIIITAYMFLTDNSIL